jgi:uncharacterized protein (TIGR03083 family)
LEPLPITDTRALFRPVSSELVALLRRLPADAWQRPTIAGSWVVRDILAHLVDLTFRRLSFHRDGMPPPPPSRPITSEKDFIDFINGLNRDFVDATRRFSPRVLTDLFEKGSADLADFFEQLPLEAPALFPVSWAGEQTSEGWFDVGREFTELWHHQAQIHLAVGAPTLAAPRTASRLPRSAGCRRHLGRRRPARSGGRDMDARARGRPLGDSVGVPWQGGRGGQDLRSERLAPALQRAIACAGLLGHRG